MTQTQIRKSVTCAVCGSTNMFLAPVGRCHSAYILLTDSQGVPLYPGEERVIQITRERAEALRAQGHRVEKFRD